MKKTRQKKFDWYGLSQRFSIRKYHFGAASVLLGAFLSVGAVSEASADSVDESNESSVVKVDERATTAVNEGVTDVTNNSVASEATELSGVKPNNLTTAEVNDSATVGNNQEVASETEKVSENQKVSTAKEAALKVIASYKYLSNDSKESYTSRVKNAGSIEEVDAIIAEAKERDEKRQETFPSQGDKIPEGEGFRATTSDQNVSDKLQEEAEKMQYINQVTHQQNKPTLVKRG